MGNSQGYRVFENEPIASWEQLTYDSAQGIFCEYIGSGDTPAEAREQLQKVCRKHNIPEPGFHPGYKRWFAGKFEINYRQHLNPVWYKKRNGKYLAFIFYYRTRCL